MPAPIEEAIVCQASQTQQCFLIFQLFQSSLPKTSKGYSILAWELLWLVAMPMPMPGTEAGKKIPNAMSRMMTRTTIGGGVYAAGNITVRSLSRQSLWESNIGHQGIV